MVLQVPWVLRASRARSDRLARQALRVRLDQRVLWVLRARLARSDLQARQVQLDLPALLDLRVILARLVL